MKRDLYQAVQEAIDDLPEGTKPIGVIAGPDFKLPPTAHLLPPFISMASLRWDIPPERQAVMVKDEFADYNADMARRISEDPRSLFGIPFSRGSFAKNAELIVVNGHGDIRGIDYRGAVQ